MNHFFSASRVRGERGASAGRARGERVASAGRAGGKRGRPLVCDQSSGDLASKQLRVPLFVGKMDINEKVIELVRKHKCLYDFKDKYYRNTTYKLRLWEDIAREIKTTSK